MRRKWVIGSASPIPCAHAGMPRNGNIKPDSRNGQEEEERHLHRLKLVLAMVEKVKPTADWRR